MFSRLKEAFGQQKGAKVSRDMTALDLMIQRFIDSILSEDNIGRLQEATKNLVEECGTVSCCFRYNKLGRGVDLLGLKYMELAPRQCCFCQ